MRGHVSSPDRTTISRTLKCAQFFRLGQDLKGRGEGLAQALQFFQRPAIGHGKGLLVRETKLLPPFSCHCS
jgi:hypothetical protein